VNDTVAPWGLILRRLHVYTKCRSSFSSTQGKKEKNLVQAVQVIAFFLRHVVHKSALKKGGVPNSLVRTVDFGAFNNTVDLFSKTMYSLRDIVKIIFLSRVTPLSPTDSQLQIHGFDSQWSLLKQKTSIFSKPQDNIAVDHTIFASRYQSTSSSRSHALSQQLLRVGQALLASR
jgi:hypothetical protein